MGALTCHYREMALQVDSQAFVFLSSSLRGKRTLIVKTASSLSLSPPCVIIPTRLPLTPNRRPRSCSLRRPYAMLPRSLPSCGCNCLRQWDTTYRTPKESQAVRLFTGDILAIEASDGRVFTAGADGSLRSWVIPRSGGLEEGPARERAHEGRVAACVAEGGRVYTVSYDGSIKVG